MIKILDSFLVVALMIAAGIHLWKGQTDWAVIAMVLINFLYITDVRRKIDNER